MPNTQSGTPVVSVIGEHPLVVEALNKLNIKLAVTSSMVQSVPTPLEQSLLEVLRAVIARGNYDDQGDFVVCFLQSEGDDNAIVPINRAIDVIKAYDLARHELGIPPAHLD